MELVEKKERNIQEELKRFNEISRYGKKLVIEQAPPKTPPAPATPPPAGEAGAAPETLPPPPPEGAAAGPGGELGPEPGGAGAPPAPGGSETPLPPEGDEEKPTDKDPTLDDETEEVDVTDLVNMTKSIKKQLETAPKQDTGVTQKMDDVFNKLNDLESKLGEMDTVISKIDQLGAEFQKTRPKTPVEKLEMRSLDSYPFNKKPDEFFAEKQQEMKDSGKNEYVLTKGDVENYSKNQIMKSFNPDLPNNYY